MAMRHKSIAVLAAATTAVFITGLTAAQEASAASQLILAPGTYNVDTTNLTLTGPLTNVTGVAKGGIALFKFGTINVEAGAAVVATGKRPFELMATGTLTVAGTIVAAGTAATTSTPGPNAGGAGGGAGGVDFTSAGSGPGGGGHASTVGSGAGGGGFGGRGAAGGLNGSTGSAGSRGAVYGDLNVKLQGGSGGGGASTSSGSVGGGGGGGAIGLFGSTVKLLAGAVLEVNGGSGNGGGDGASGGGSGGGIIVHGNTVTFTGGGAGSSVLEANGGDGGTGGCCGDGGGGGGGRIAIQYKSLSETNLVITEVLGGASGTSGPDSHGQLSPQANGGLGQITYAQIDRSTLTMNAPKSAAAGKSVKVSTKLTDAGTGNGVSDQTVTLYSRANHAGSHWSKVASKTTSATGTASDTLTSNATRIYQWRFGGTLIHLAATSPSQTITVT